MVESGLILCHGIHTILSVHISEDTREGKMRVAQNLLECQWRGLESEHAKTPAAVERYTVIQWKMWRSNNSLQSFEVQGFKDLGFVDRFRLGIDRRRVNGDGIEQFVSYLCCTDDLVG
ncbi:hypothetical protein ZIOFF_055966 [Zingiber officinale]|uniref:Uncharacterized protein n=1 Tax=Zingiber officinale TaxID=94328 RepID=A0A8J5FHA9_ZINOF|nr:hypothetical protein ZIOFF_055966 [Zingiber officinale]